jgi:hypothetical protein
MRFSIEPPKTSEDFEHLCLLLLRRHWNAPQLQRYAHDGDKQDGVDIFDPYAGSPHRGAQCKLRDRSKTLPPKELKDEVAKAVAYSPPLNHFIVFTTGKVSKQADDTVKAINQKHREKNLFTLELLNWERIEQLLDLYPNVRDLLYKTVSGEQVASIDYKLSVMLAKVEDRSTGSSSDAIDNELEESKQAISDNQPLEARRIITKLTTKFGDRLNARQNWRVKTQLAGSFICEGEIKQAGRLLIEASPHQPNDEFARINEAAGYEMLEKKD